MLDTRFYENYKIKPGYGFYKALIEADKVIPLRHLKGIYIPNFLITIKHDTSHVFQDDKGNFIIDNRVNIYSKFEEHILENCKFKYKKQNWLPMMITRVKSDYEDHQGDMRILVKSYKDLRDKKDFNPPDGGIK
jgi:hypothetical protein